MKFIHRNKELSEGLGKFNVKCNIWIKDSDEPVFKTPRRVPEAINLPFKAP